MKLNFREVEKKVLDSILSSDVYDKKMRPNVSLISYRIIK